MKRHDRPVRAFNTALRAEQIHALTDAFDGNAILPTLLAHKIYEVLAEKYTLRSKWAKNQSVERSPKPRPRAG